MPDALDYSRFDHIGESDSEEEGSAPAAGGHAQGPEPSAAEVLGEEGGQLPGAAPPRPPENVIQDLEDYFERLDARRGEAEAAGTPLAASAASVERFTEEDLACLRRCSSGPSADAEDRECAICLLPVLPGETLALLPCAAAHAFHEDCARQWLSRNVTCPLCRVDVRQLVRREASPQPAAQPPSPRAFGYTRDGGIIARYDPRPPPEEPRPAYVPQELHGVAELVEISYPNRGTARVWRVPR